MSIGMHAMSVPLMKRGLENLSTILGKASAHVEANKIDPNALLGFRLYPDMLPFTRQIIIACFFARSGAGKLGDIEVPKFDDPEASFAAYQEYIARTLAYLDTVDAKVVDASAERQLSVTLGQRTLELSGYEYISKYALPNFYFHLATAYDMLRHNGVPLGKADFIGG